MPDSFKKLSLVENRQMLVVIHDFSSVFLPELTEIVDALDPVVGTQISAAVVPRWHGHQGCASNGQYRDLLKRCREPILHGWTHQNANRMRPMSLLTDGANEFSGLNEAQIYRRLEQAQAEFREMIGRNAEGLLAPAWQLSIPASQFSNLKFLMRFRSIDSCQEDGLTRPLATWSWDWGRIGWLGYGGDWIGRVLHRTRRQAVPCIAIHPIDLQRGFFTRALNLIQTFKQNGYQAVTAAELLAPVETVL